MTGAVLFPSQPAIAQSQTFALANNNYKTIQQWTVTGQTDDPLAPFGTVSGSKTYGTTPPIQGPAFWFGYNPVFLSSQANPYPAHGAVGLSCFGDAGDSNNGAGGHGLEMNPAAFVTPNGGKATNAFQMVAMDDNTNTVNTTIRCGTGTVNGVSSNIIFQNADASTTFMQMFNAASSLAIYVPVNMSSSGIVDTTAGALTWTLTSSGSSSVFNVIANGTTQPSIVAATSGTGTGILVVSGNNASTLNAQINFQTSGATKWQIQHYSPNYLWFACGIAPSGYFAQWNPAATSNAGYATFYANVKSAGGMICGTAALATTATGGFLYLPTCPGPPTGVPATQTGTAAAVYDTTDDKLYVYNGAWKSVTLA
jgi:hypothetical protein